MAAPVAAFIQLPTDSGNTGKKVQTQSEVIGADTVHAHYFIPRTSRKVVGGYYFTSGVLVSVTTAHTQLTGHLWLEMPTGAAVRGRLRDIVASMVLGVTVTADVTTLYRLLSIARFTFTGAASGALLTPAKRRSSDVANVANVRTAATGMTITAGGLFWTLLTSGFLDFDAITTSGADTIFTYMENAVGARFNPDNEDAFLDFDAGEGIVVYQPDGGATTWRMVVSGHWDEYDDA
jgi:hypothetical protein